MSASSQHLPTQLVAATVEGMASRLRSGRAWRHQCSLFDVVPSVRCGRDAGLNVQPLSSGRLPALLSNADLQPWDHSAAQSLQCSFRDGCRALSNEPSLVENDDCAAENKPLNGHHAHADGHAACIRPCEVDIWGSKVLSAAPLRPLSIAPVTVVDLAPSTALDDARDVDLQLLQQRYASR